MTDASTTAPDLSSASAEIEIRGPRFAMIPEWVLDSRLPDKAVRLYGILARYANSECQCWPSQETLAKRMRINVRTVQRAVADLIEHGALEVIARPNTSNLYVLGGDPPSALADKNVVQVDDKNVGTRTTKMSSKRESVNESQLNDTRRPTPSLFEEGSPEAQRASASPFDEWWATYPRKIDKKPARVVYDARLREGVEPGQLLLAAKHYAQTREGEPSKFTKHPKTFLAKDGPWTEWVNGPPEGEVPPAIYDGELEWDARTLSWRVAE